jgi:hypothetical protein
MASVTELYQHETRAEWYRHDVLEENPLQASLCPNTVLCDIYSRAKMCCILCILLTTLAWTHHSTSPELLKWIPGRVHDPQRWVQCSAPGLRACKIALRLGEQSRLSSGDSGVHTTLERTPPQYQTHLETPEHRSLHASEEMWTSELGT